jgi:hypothetical protein
MWLGVSFVFMLTNESPFKALLELILFNALLNSVVD